jgi:hypothetical protein
MFLIDGVSPLTELIHFQQLIFLQDRIILENQRPTLLPLEPRGDSDPGRCLLDRLSALAEGKGHHLRNEC